MSNDTGKPRRWGVIGALAGAFAVAVVPAVRAEESPPASQPPATQESPATAPPQSPAEPPALATEGERRIRFFRFRALAENDGTEFIKPNHSTDRHYTSGQKIDFAWQPDWARKAANALPFWDRTNETTTAAFGVSAALLIFTPANLDINPPDPDDRPYAGWLYAGLYFQRARDLTPRIGTFEHIEVDLGVVGPSSLAEEAQREIHRIINDDQPEGWDHQLKDEFAINVMYRRKLRLRLEEQGDKDKLRWGLDFIAEGGFDVGTVYRQGVLGATFRFGQNLPDDYGPARIADVGAATGRRRGDRFAWYLFARVQGRAVEHNIFLDGNTWRDSRSVSKEPLVGELHVGGVIVLFEHLEIGYSQTFLTDEFKSQSSDDSFGAWTIAWSKTF